MAAYQAAVDWGATCMEISVQMTVRRGAHLHARPRLRPDDHRHRTGARAARHRCWTPPASGSRGSARPGRSIRRGYRSSRTSCKTFGGRVVLAVEAKLDAAYVPMMAMVEKYGLQKSVIVKAHYKSRRWAQAKLAGYPVFCYFGVGGRHDAGHCSTPIAAQLDPLRDYLVIPGVNGSTTSPTPPSRRRSTPASRSGCTRCTAAPTRSTSSISARRGAICSSYGYIAGATTPVTADSWASQAIAAGEMSRNPADRHPRATAVTPAGEMVLAAKGSQHFITVGQLGSVSGRCGFVLDQGRRVVAHPAGLQLGQHLRGLRPRGRFVLPAPAGQGRRLITRSCGPMARWASTGTGTVRWPASLLAPEVATPALRTGPVGDPAGGRHARRR